MCDQYCENCKCTRCTEIRKMNKFKDWKQFRDHEDEIWKIHWDNPLSLSMENPHSFWNNGREEGDSLVFYKDVECGHKEKCIISKYNYNNDESFKIIIMMNNDRFHYNDYEIMYSYVVKPDDSIL